MFTMLAFSPAKRRFRFNWDACANMGKATEARQELVRKLVDCVYVEGTQIVAIVLHKDLALLLGENETAHANLASAVQKRLRKRIITANLSNQSRDDGFRPLIGYTYWVSQKPCKQLRKRNLLPPFR
ncbi:MAG: hypothetical protein U0452_13535 [Anaerolineae bacterium]